VRKSLLGLPAAQSWHPQAKAVHLSRLLLVLPALLLGLAGTVATTAPAAAASTTWYVASGGTASGCTGGAGSSSDPFGTIAGALSCAADGDVVSVGPGSFAGGFTLAHNVTLLGAGASLTTVTGVASTLSPVPASEVTLATGVQATLEGLSVIGGGSPTGSTWNALSMTSGVLVLDQVLAEDTLATPTGAVLYANPSGASAAVTVQASTLATTSGLDGGLFVSDSTSTVTVLDSTIDTAANIFPSVGVQGADLYMLDDTVGATNGVALRAIGGTKLTLGGTVLTGGNAASVCSLSYFDDLGNNLFSGAIGDGCPVANGANGDEVASSAGLGALGYNGGPTPTMALLPGSPATDANSLSNCTSSLVNGLDQRGVPRDAIDRGTCDIGAYDTAGAPYTTLYVTSTGTASGCTGGAGSASDPFGTIAGALSCAADGDLVSVGPGNFAGGFTVAENVVIEGAGSSETSIGAAPAGSTAEVTVAPATHVVLANLAVTGTGGSTAAQLADGSLTLVGVLAENLDLSGEGTVFSSPPAGTTAELSILRSTVLTGAFDGTDDALELVAHNASNASLTSTATVVNSTVSAGLGEQGAIAVNDTGLVLEDDTVADSNNFDVVGIGGSTLTIGGTILAGAGSSGADCNGFVASSPQPSLVDQGNNLVSAPGECTFTNGANADLVGTTSSPLAAGLGLLGYYGGGTPTLPLEPGSPAIGTNSVSNCTNVLVANLDQRGLPRNATTRGACDIGAYDTGGSTTLPPTLTSLNPPSGPSAGHRYLELFGSGLSPNSETCLWYKGSGCAGISVQIGSAAAFVIYGSPSELLVLTPPGSPGAVSVTLSVAGQKSTVISAYLYT
jgi:hypothetical protein